MVGLGVVAAAEEFEVLEVGFTTICPVDDVVSVAPAGRPVTAGDDTPPIPEVQRSALGGTDGTGATPHI